MAKLLPTIEKTSPVSGWLSDFLLSTLTVFHLPPTLTRVLTAPSVATQ